MGGKTAIESLDWLSPWYIIKTVYIGLEGESSQNGPGFRYMISDDIFLLKIGG